MRAWHNLKHLHGIVPLAAVCAATILGCSRRQPATAAAPQPNQSEPTIKLGQSTPQQQVAAEIQRKGVRSLQRRQIQTLITTYEGILSHDPKNQAVIDKLTELRDKLKKLDDR